MYTCIYIYVYILRDYHYYCYYDVEIQASSSKYSLSTLPSADQYLSNASTSLSIDPSNWDSIKSFSRETLFITGQENVTGTEMILSLEMLFLVVL